MIMSTILFVMLLSTKTSYCRESFYATVINFFFLLSQVIGILGRIAFFLKLGFSFHLMAYIFWERVKKIHEVGVFFLKVFLFFLYKYTYYPWAVRWGRLVGGKFPVPDCPSNTNMTLAILPINTNYFLPANCQYEYE